MTTTTHTEDAGSAGTTPVVVPGPSPVDAFVPEPGGTRIDVPLGRRVMVVSDLLLTPDATPSTLALTTELARALDTWDGPGILIIAGNLFDLTGCDDLYVLASDIQHDIAPEPSADFMLQAMLFSAAPRSGASL